MPLGRRACLQRHRTSAEQKLGAQIRFARSRRSCARWEYINQAGIAGLTAIEEIKQLP